MARGWTSLEVGRDVGRREVGEGCLTVLTLPPSPVSCSDLSLGDNLLFIVGFASPEARFGLLLGSLLGEMSRFLTPGSTL